MSNTMLVVVPCDHRLKRGDKCLGHLVEVSIPKFLEVKDGKTNT